MAELVSKRGTKIIEWPAWDCFDLEKGINGPVELPLLKNFIGYHLQFVFHLKSKHFLVYKETTNAYTCMGI